MLRVVVMVFAGHYANQHGSGIPVALLERVICTPLAVPGRSTAQYCTGTVYPTLIAALTCD
jgi:hypothetical protein